MRHYNAAKETCVAEDGDGLTHRSVLIQDKPKSVSAKVYEQHLSFGMDGPQIRRCYVLEGQVTFVDAVGGSENDCYPGSATSGSCVFSLRHGKAVRVDISLTLG